MPTHFEQLETHIHNIKSLTPKADATGFFLQEVLRFYSIAGTLLRSDITLDKTSNVDQRYFTHPLARSLLEPFFIILYIFEDPAQMASRYEEQINTFKDNYRKLMNDLREPEWQQFMQGEGSKLEAEDPNWKNLQKLPNMKDLLGKLTHSNNQSFEFLYPLYRVTSFDTHGQSLGTIFEAVFKKPCNFPVLDVGQAIEQIAYEYIQILNDLNSRKLI